MSQTEHEQLSALMDGELDSHQFRFLLRRMDSHASLHATWERFHVAGDTLRQDMHVLADPGLADRIMHEIEAGSTAARRPHATHRWLRWSAGGAIAAGVAVAALVTIQPRMHGDMSVHRPASVAAAPVASSSRTVAATGGVAASPAANEPMNAPSVPRWLSASPAAARLAQPAAATFSPGGQPLGASGQPYGHESSGLAPYMTIPHAHGLEIRSSESPQSGHRWWKAAAPRHGWRFKAQ